MSEPFEVTDLDQLDNIIVSVTLPLPDGREALIKLRPLSAKEVRDIRRAITWPTPPVTDFGVKGNPATPVYDFQDKAYREADEEADALLLKRMLVASLLINITGETVDQKCEALDQKLGQFAVSYLMQVISKINTPSKEDIEAVMRSFRAVGTVGASDNGQSVTYPIGVEKLTEERTAGNGGLSASGKRKSGSSH